MRRLIINADDFGLTQGVNRAIREASRSGVVTSATIMANSRAFDEAVASAKALPGLKTGCHVVLIDGEPVSSGLASLTNGGTRFRSSLKQFALAAVRKKISADEIEREAAAQIRKIQAAGIALTHVDTHKHTHMFPHVLRPVLRAARACGLRAVRNPFEPRRSWPVGKVLGAPALWVRAAEVFMLRTFVAEFHKAVREANMLTTDGTVGIAATGVLDQKMLAAILKGLPEGIWELVCHPGYADADLQSAGTRLLGSREAELQALTSAETKSLISRCGIELISYADLS
ncbi:MAG: ChbG/HpnK family deacetylase [Acidobacteriia bacterium]|nr:ChbG/HpnK family deacetylase [Terriglobia bacterium]